ncbi:MAG: hypothetical protein PVSMB7_28260 [Chloroflexota bacterium]
MERDLERPDNRSRKVAGRMKRRRYVQGTRAYTHAMTNSIARRAAAKRRPETEEPSERA